MQLNFAISISAAHSVVFWLLLLLGFFFYLKKMFLIFVLFFLISWDISFLSIFFLLEVEWFRFSSNETLSKGKRIGQMPLCAWAEIGLQWSNDHYLGNLILGKILMSFCILSTSESKKQMMFYSSDLNFHLLIFSLYFFTTYMSVDLMNLSWCYWKQENRCRSIH